jgi:hypothetical protein
LEENDLFHEFIARLATGFAMTSSNITVTNRHDRIERREKRAAKRENESRHEG